MRILLALLATALAAAAELPYVATFDAASDWEAAGPAAVSPYGRQGKCLLLSTYAPDAAAARWTSPAIPVTAGTVTVAGWVAPNLAFTQDMGYGAVVAAVVEDGAGKELRRQEIRKIYKRPHKDKYDFYRLPDADGLAWEYFEGAVQVPDGRLRVVFAWADFTAAWRYVERNVRGEVYLDDVSVRAGAPPPAPPTADKAAPDYPVQVRVNTPVSGNVFLAGDPLSFTVRLDAAAGLPAADGKAVLRYRVEDFQHLRVAAGEVPLAQPVRSWGDSLLKTFYLDPALRQEVGRWLALRVTLIRGAATLGVGETAFIITDPRQLTLEQMERSHFWGSGRVEPPLDPNAPWGPSQRPNLDEKQGCFGFKSHGWDLGWAKRQPAADSPISFAGDFPGKDYPMHSASQQTFAFHERQPLRSHWLHYTQRWDGIPAWARQGDVRADENLNAEAWGRYVEEYVRHTSAMVYYVTSPEGGSIEHFARMAEAGYRAVKRVDPRLQVAAQVNFLEGAPLAKQLCESGLIDFVDICVFDNYSTRQGQPVREFRDTCAQYGKHKTYWIQEYCYTGSLYPAERTRRMADYCVWAIAHGVDRLRWYANHFEVPGIRAPLPSSGVVFAMNGMLEGQGEKLADGMTTLPGIALTKGYVRGNMFPFLQWGMYYQLQQHFQIEEPREVLAWGKDVEGALFDGVDTSTAAVWRPSTAPPVNLLVDSGGVPLTVTDMYGRRVHIRPVGGKCLLTVGPDPLLFRSDRKLATFTATPTASTVRVEPALTTAGGTATVTVHLANEFGRAWAADVTPTVDDSWTVEPASRSVALAPGDAADLTFKLAIPADAAAGTCPLLVDLVTPAGPGGRLTAEVGIAPPLGVELVARPWAPGRPAAVVVTLSNRSAAPVQGNLRVLGDFGAGPEPLRPAADVALAPGEEKAVTLALGDWAPDLNRDYPATAVFAAADGRVVTARHSLSFRGVPRRTTPVTIDGKLDDWDTAKLPGLTFNRLFSRGGASWGGFDFDLAKVTREGPADNAGRFWLQWDDTYLYWAFEFTDDKYLPGGKGVGIWSHDALSLLLYPFAVQPGERITGTNYKEHIGLDEDGHSTYDRMQGTVGDWHIGSGQPEGVNIVVHPTDTGCIMEFAVPIAHYAPLRPEPGAAFSIGCLYWDRDTEQNQAPDTIAWYYALTNVDTNPSMFGVFRLME